jgi:hypothetical protein
MSFKTCTFDSNKSQNASEPLSGNNVTINDKIKISFNVENLLHSMKYPEFNNINIQLLNNTTQEEYNQIIKSYYTPFRLINKNTILTNEMNQYVVSNIVYKKIFSQFLPDFPLIEIINTNKSIVNSCIFLNGEPFGIQIDEKYILPFSILFPLLYNLSINNGRFIWSELKFEMLEINQNSGEDTTVAYYGYLKQELRYNICNKVVKINEGIIVYNINNNKFNKNGRIYSDVLQIFCPVNLYLLLFGGEVLNFEYSNYSIDNDKDNDKMENEKIIDIPIKNTKITLPLISNSYLKIPITSNLKYKYRGYEFSVLSEKIMEIYNDCPLTEIQFKKNNISKHSYIVLTNHEDGLLYILKKISNKNINSYETLVDYIEKNSDKNKNTFYFERYDKSIKISI